MFHVFFPVSKHILKNICKNATTLVFFRPSPGIPSTPKALLDFNLKTAWRTSWRKTGQQKSLTLHNQNLAISSHFYMKLIDYTFFQNSVSIFVRIFGSVLMEPSSGNLFTPINISPITPTIATNRLTKLSGHFV